MKPLNKQQYLRQIPSVDEVLRRDEIQHLLRKYTRTVITKAVKMLLAEKRSKFLSSADVPSRVHELSTDVTLSQIKTKLNEILEPSLKRVINATGVVIHTNLGRAPLAEKAVEHLVDIARRYSNLEFDIESGERGSRYTHVEDLLKELTGAQSAFVVNNNAAAVLLCLNTLARDREVIISRGELIEIGGSFRIPEIMNNSGAKLIEVGTTNRTHLEDYRDAINDNTALLLKVHTSNYKIMGFTAEVELGVLKKLGKKFGIPVMLDMGSGNLMHTSLLGLGDEPLVQDAVIADADIITFSGDKLLGAAQSGLILGKSELIKKIAKNPLSRALRVDKLTLAALEATLRMYCYNPEQFSCIPVLGMLSISEKQLRKRAQKIVKALKAGNLPAEVICERDVSRVGGGAYPQHELPTWVVAILPHGISAQRLEALLRNAEPPLITRIHNDKVLLDMRTLFPEEVRMVVDTVRFTFSASQRIGS